ncbi:DNA polymerase III subunit beta [Candidatus Uhrbacteria bacterium]|nr:DNA polymerase III subunit beta [Candidatus Uhrbacteria bacterium]
MKFSCTKENLHKALTITSHLPTRQANLPILQNVLLKAGQEGVRFSTTNLEMAVSCLVRGKVDEAGEHTIPSKLFSEYIALLPNEVVHILQEGDSVELICIKNKTKIKGIPSSEFPLVPSVHDERVYEIPVEALRSALSRVLFAVATNESRPELTGVSLRFVKGGDLVMAATDSYRLAEAVIRFQGEVATEADAVILPAKTLQELNRILGVFRDEAEAPSCIAVGFSESQAVFRYGNVELTSRTIEGAYPDYRQIIPKTFETETVVDREDLVKSVKTASLFSHSGLFDVTLGFQPDEKVISITGNDVTRGENTAECDVEIFGKKNTVTVNFRYLLDGLQALQDTKTRLKLIDDSNPLLLSSEGASDQYLYLVMPIRQ